MTLKTTTTNTTSTALVVRTEKRADAKKPVPAEKPAAPKGDTVEIDRGYKPDEIPADDDGPGAGGGYEPEQEPVEGPGAGGGYDQAEIPFDDDGPGAGGGYDYVEQDPAESDGPGAGGGYFTESLGFTTRGAWNQPLTVFSASPDGKTYTANTFAHLWTSGLPEGAYSWTGKAALETLTLDSSGNVQTTTVKAEPTPKKAGEK